MLLISVLMLAAAPACADQLLAFQAPSGNIFCLMADGERAETRCDLRVLQPSFTGAPADCEQDWGDSFAVSPGDAGGRLVCHGDTVVEPGATVLSYGSRIRHGGITCAVSKAGVRCVNAGGHGFAVARGAQSVF